MNSYQLLSLIDPNHPYIKEKDSGLVYKVLPNHFLRMSPGESSNRRVYEISDDNYHILTSNNACMIVNKQFQDTEEKWEHDGKRFYSPAIPQSSNVDVHAAMLAMLPSHQLIKSAEEDLLNSDNMDCISCQSKNSEFKMVKHKGKIYYILIVKEYLPRVQVYNMFGKFCQWANVKHCKPIFCENTKKFL